GWTRAVTTGRIRAVRPLVESHLVLGLVWPGFRLTECLRSLRVTLFVGRHLQFTVGSYGDPVASSSDGGRWKSGSSRGWRIRQAVPSGRREPTRRGTVALLQSAGPSLTTGARGIEACLWRILHRCDGAEI